MRLLVAILQAIVIVAVGAQLFGVELVKDRGTREPDGELATALLARCADLGLLVLSCGPAHNVVRWIPPINVTAAEIVESLEIFGEGLRTVGAVRA